MSEERPPEETQGVVKDFMIKTFDPWLESKSASNMLIIFFLLLAAIPIVGIGLATTRTILPRDLIKITEQLPQQIHIPTIPSSASSVSAVFTCARGKSVTAIFGSNSVDLTLSDGRHLTLPQASAGNGTQFANPDESFVFSDTGNTASIHENGTTSYIDCVTNR